jgi:hypothetical protein
MRQEMGRNSTYFYRSGSLRNLKDPALGGRQGSVVFLATDPRVSYWLSVCLVSALIVPCSLRLSVDWPGIVSDIILTVSFLCLLIDFVMQCLVRKSLYFCSIQALTDLLGTLSIVLGTDWAMQSAASLRGPAPLSCLALMRITKLGESVSLMLRNLRRKHLELSLDTVSLVNENLQAMLVRNCSLSIALVAIVVLFLSTNLPVCDTTNRPSYVFWADRQLIDLDPHEAILFEFSFADDCKPLSVVSFRLANGAEYSAMNRFVPATTRKLDETEISYANELGEFQAIFSIESGNQRLALFTLLVNITVIILVIVQTIIIDRSCWTQCLSPLGIFLSRFFILSNSLYSKVRRLSSSNERASFTSFFGGDSCEVLSSAEPFEAESELLEKISEKINNLMNLHESPFNRSNVHNATDLAVLHSLTEGNLPKVFGEASDSHTTSPTRVLDALTVQNISFDQILKLEKSSLTLGNINSWELDPLVLSQTDTVLLLDYIFYHSPQAAFAHRVSPRLFAEFLSKIQLGYNDNPYHNFAHAVDVTHTVYRFIDLSSASSFLKPIDRLALLLSGLMHDLGHMGVNNLFLVETSHELAIRFNDRSPLENFHCAQFFEILRSANVLEWLMKEELKEFRKVLIDAVLHTDNFHHFGMVKDLNVFIERHAAALDSQNFNDLCDILKAAESRNLVCNLFLHSADISNPTKPFSICQRWAILVMEEFFAQGDRERSLGIAIQPLNDRSSVNVAQSQVGFIEFVLAPLELAKFQIFPVFADNCQFLVGNMVQWASEYVLSSSVSLEEEEKLLERCRRVGCKFEAIPAMGGVYVPSSIRPKTFLPRNIFS